MDTDKISQLKIQRAEARRPPLRRLGAFAAVFLLLCAMAAGGYWLYDEGLLSTATSVEVVSVNWVYPSQVVTDFNASGYVVAQRRAAVASKGTGRLDYLAVREGSRVKEGDILARLENDDLRAERDQIHAQLASARADRVRAETDAGIAERQYTRLRNLWEQKAVAKADYENARDQFQRARAVMESAAASIRALEAGLKRASVLIEYTVIRAPFDGVVLTKDADVGEVVAPFGSSVNAKAAVVTMADLNSLMVETDVSESSLPKVREGQPCEIQLDALSETRLSRRLEEHEKQPFVAVHRDAVTQRNGRKGLFLVDGNQVRWAPWTEPEVVGDYIRLDGSFKVGDRVVLKPSRELRDGSRVSLPE